MPGLATARLAAKKKTLHASERDTDEARQARRDYWTQLSGCALERVKFVDESGMNVAMTRRFGRAPVGQRVHDAVPKNWGKNITILGALSCGGLDAVMTIKGATDAAVFLTYVSEVLAPTLRPGDLVVMDNLGAHKGEGIATAIEARGARLLYLPPYSPDYSPIEACWSKLKTFLRAAKARTREALEQALVAAMDWVTAADVQGWFNHCGYPLH
jgi:transposase/uncharacterized protein YnzC (UPF0291/DUF896 family)